MTAGHHGKGGRMWANGTLGAHAPAARTMEHWIDLPMFPPLGCCAAPEAERGGHGRRRHQERKHRMLTYWRDGLERQLAAVNAALSTLERQMERDQPSPGG